MRYHYLYRRFTYSVRLYRGSRRVFALSSGLALGEMCGRHSQVGSLAGAAHLLKDNAGVLR